MKHVAIDLGGRESQLCVREADGTIVEERKVPTLSLVDLVKGWEPRRLIVETCSEAFHVAEAARAASHEVRIVPATLVRSLNVGARGIKTDRRDARALSEASCRIDLGSVHLPSKISRELKSICGAREQLVEMRTALINNVRGWLRTQLWRIKSGGAESFHARVRAHAAGLDRPLPDHVERMVSVLEMLVPQIRAADAQVARFAKTEPVCVALQTAPGVGPITAVRFFAALDDVSRFPSAHALESYLGLTPGEYSSSDRRRRTGITKAGPTQVRKMLVQAAWAAIRRAPEEPMVKWCTRVAERRGKNVAVVALARKLAGILFAIWRDGTVYNATRSAA